MTGREHWSLFAEHHSSKYLGDPDQLYVVIKAALRRVPIVSVTEVDRSGRGDALEEIPHADLVRGPDGARGETAVLVDERRCTVLARRRTMLTDDMDGMRGGQVAVAVLVRDRTTGRTVLYSATHTASGVEGAGGRLWRAGRRAVEYRQAAVAWRRWLNELDAEWWPDARIAAGDMNINLLRPAVQAFAKTLWRRARLPHFTGRGTHGPRLIDWFVSWRLRRPLLMVLPKRPAVSDHHPIRLAGTVRPRRPRRGGKRARR